VENENIHWGGLSLKDSFVSCSEEHYCLQGVEQMEQNADAQAHSLAKMTQSCSLWLVFFLPSKQLQIPGS